ncbi:MAG: beta-lactamase domain-containing protein [Candidatus Frackibacter sp. T328-2]|nr:MAG: beta-lactamase domain-containing protein [Candidatus Frackibacter sp. T328-2]
MNKKQFIAFTLIVTLIIALSFSTNGFASNKLKIHFVNVGQADSILLQLPNGENMLIDAGNNEDGHMIVNYIRNQNINRIDYLVGTHPHEDHIGGLDNVINSFSIGEIYMPNITHTSQTFEDVLRAIKIKGKKINTAKEYVTILDEGNIKAEILSPVTNNYDDLNNWSAVIKLTYNSTSFLFMGDAEHIVENQLLRLGTELNTDVLKVGHHGSYSSTTNTFLNYVSPKYTVISVGKYNTYGHPSSTVLNRLQRYGVKTYRTDKQGTIIATSNGNTISFNKQAGPTNNTQNKKSTKASGITITNVDLSKEIVILKNNSDQTIDLSGWKLVSIKGHQQFYLPPGTSVSPGNNLKIASGRQASSGPNSIIWTKAYIWNNDGDSATLYGLTGRKISHKKGW